MIISLLNLFNWLTERWKLCLLLMNHFICWNLVNWVVLTNWVNSYSNVILFLSFLICLSKKYWNNTFTYLVWNQIYSFWWLWLNVHYLKVRLVLNMVFWSNSRWINVKLLWILIDLSFNKLWTRECWSVLLRSIKLLYIIIFFLNFNLKLFNILVKL